MTLELASLLNDKDGSDEGPILGSPTNQRVKLLLKLRLRHLYGKILKLLPREKGIPSFILALAPSFFQSSYEYNTKLHPTSWLDGLRGFAALFVYFAHYILVWYPTLDKGYASGPDEYYIAQLPYIRVIFSGFGMVCLFFVISGYVLSYSSLQKIRNGDLPALFDTLASSVFRRWLRLFLPIFVSTFITMLIARAGLWININAIKGPEPRETLFEQLGEWWVEFVNISNPTYWPPADGFYETLYGIQLWTIPREFRGSMVTYIVLLCLARTRQAVRLTLMILFSLYTLWAQQWDLFLFLAGMFLAELQLLLHDQSNEYYRESTTYNYLPKSIHRHLAAIMHTFTGGLILVAGHLLGFPSWNADVSPGYTTLIKYTPQAYNSTILVQRFWQSIGAFLFVLALCLSPAPSPSLSSPSPLLASSPSPSSPPSHSSPFLQRPFNTPFAQYLGRISFGLYITHYYVLGTLGARIFLYVPSSMATEKACAFVFAGVVNTFLCFWIADLFWRAVDVKSVRVGKWIAGRCFVC